MTEIEQLLERQARWQKSRAALSWAEKLRLAETLREAALALGCGHRNQPRIKADSIRGSGDHSHR